MVKVLCSTGATLRLGDMYKFQGDLKKRTKSNITQLADSIKADGLIMPFAVWQDNDGVKWILDGHGRLAALTELALTDNDIATQDFPVLYIKAETEEQAKQDLLQITSTYGRITKDGAVKFCAAIPQYRAPAINKYVHKKTEARKSEQRASYVLVKLRVPVDKEASVKSLLKQVSYIEVL